MTQQDIFGDFFNDEDLKFLEQGKTKSKTPSNKDFSSKAMTHLAHREQKLITRTTKALEVLPASIKENETLTIVSNGSFGSNNLFRAINQKYNIKKLWCTAWSINDLFVEVIKEINPDQFYFFCDRSILTRKAHYWAKITRETKHLPDVKLMPILKLHAKVSILETEKSGNIIYDASANFSQNFRIEQYNLYKNEELYDFHKSWMSSLLR